MHRPCTSRLISELVPVAIVWVTGVAINGQEFKTEDNLRGTLAE